MAKRYYVDAASAEVLERMKKKFLQGANHHTPRPKRRRGKIGRRSVSTNTTTGNTDIVYGVTVDSIGPATGYADGDSWIVRPGTGIEGVELYDYWESGTAFGDGTDIIYGTESGLDRRGTGTIVNAANYDPGAVFTPGMWVYLLFMGTIDDQAWYEILSGACISFADADE